MSFRSFPKNALPEEARRETRLAALPTAPKAVEIFTRVGSPVLANAQAILTECEALL